MMLQKMQVKTPKKVTKNFHAFCRNPQNKACENAQKMV